MFNQPRPLRPAKPWQASSYVGSSREDLAFSAARWTEEAPAAFADSGMPVRSSGFDVDHYEAMPLPLTHQARKAWALLDNEHEQQDFAEEKNASQESSSTNAHLPFVPDVYESVTGKKNPKAQAVTSPVTVAPQDEATLPTDALANPDASAQAEFAAKERVAQDVLLSDQEPDAKALPPLDADASEARADEADTDVAEDIIFWAIFCTLSILHLHFTVFGVHDVLKVNCRTATHSV